MNTDKVFAGLKVVDLASFLAGPGAATVLSDFGADVIKVEPPGIGDPHRITYKVPPLPSAKENYAWQLSNRNKRGLALDLKSPPAGEILERLVKWADVLVVNFPHPVRKKLKLTLVSEKTGKERVYRIVAKDASPKRKGKSGRKAA